MSFKGLPFTISKLAVFPSSNVPTLSEIPKASALIFVADTIASTGDIPASTILLISPTLYFPKGGGSSVNASLPNAIFTPVLYAILNYSSCVFGASTAHGPMPL